MTEYFTSDTHFNHDRILGYCRPQYRDLDHMNRDLIIRWNKIVMPDDTVYHLGDFAMGQKVLWPEIRSRLKGKIIFMRGNHDAPWDKFSQILLPTDEVSDFRVIDTDYGKIHLAHIPPCGDPGRGYVRPGMETSADHYFCGHVHAAWRVHEDGTINVGVDVNDYEPKTLDQILNC